MRIFILCLFIFPLFTQAQTRGGGHPNPDHRDKSEALFEYRMENERLIEALNANRKKCFTSSEEIKSILELRINLGLLKAKDSKFCLSSHLVKSTDQEKEIWNCLLPSKQEREAFHKVVENSLFKEGLYTERLDDKEIKDLMEYFKTHIP